jgi:hypothetical protein
MTTQHLASGIRKGGLPERLSRQPPTARTGAAADEFLPVRSSQHLTGTGGTNMAKVLYSVTMSVDGFITGPDGDMQWMRPYLGPNPEVDELIPGSGRC